MCRFVAYAGRPVLRESLLVAPAASLVAQSLVAREAKTIVDADGSSIGWSDERDDPGFHHGMLPAETRFFSSTSLIGKELHPDVSEAIIAILTGVLLL